MHIEIKEMKTLEGMLEQFPLLLQLNPKLKKERVEEYWKEMLPRGYHFIGAFDAEKCVGVSGFWINIKLYSGKYIEVDNFVVDEKYRSSGIGKQMIDWIEEEGRKNNCRIAMLDCYLEDRKAHKFYFRQGYMIGGFHFLKKLIV